MSSVGLWAQTACLWEVNAHKAGDVNPLHGFDTLAYRDFVLSATAISAYFGLAVESESGSGSQSADRLVAAASTPRNTGIGFFSRVDSLWQNS